MDKVKSVAITAAASVAGATIFAAPFDGSVEHTVLNIILGAGAGAAASELFKAGSAHLRRPVRDFPKAVAYTFSKDPEAIDKYGEIFHESSYHQIKGEHAMKAGHLEKAIEHFAKSIAKERFQPHHKSLLHTILLRNSEGIDLKRYREDPKKAYLTVAMGWLGAGYVDRSRIFWQKAIDADPRDIDVNILYGRALEAMGETALADQQWKDLSHLVREEAAKGNIVMDPLDGADIYRLRESAVLDNVFILKQSPDPMRLEGELRLTRRCHEEVTSWLEDNGLKERFAIGRALRTVNNSAHSLISLYEKGQLIVDHLRKTKDPSILEDAARFLAIIHGLMQKYAGTPRDESEHFMRRLVGLEQTLLETGIAGEDYRDCFRMLADSYELPLSKSADSEPVFNRDAHGKNWTINPDGRMTAIDFEPRSATYAEHELSKLMETGRCLDNRPESDIARKAIVSAYRVQAAEMDLLDVPEPDELEFRKLNADLIRAVSFFCFAFDRPRERILRREYLQNAIHSSHRLQDQYVDVMEPETLRRYNTYQRGMEGLLEIDRLAA